MIQIEQHGSVTAIRMARTLLGRPLYWTTAYWLDGLLIDSGAPCLSGELLALVSDRLQVHQVVVTHAHEDHIGGLYRLRQRYPDLPIYAPQLSIPIIGEPKRLAQQFYRRLFWGVPRPVGTIEPLGLTVETENHTLRVIETPGHSRDHVAFYEPRHRWLFSGDAFIGGHDRAWSSEFEMFGTISSLRTLAALHPERIFPASGNVRRTALPELHGKIGQLIGFCRQVDQFDKAALSTGEIVERLAGGEPPIRFWTQGHFSAGNLVDAARQYNRIFDPVGAHSDLASHSDHSRNRSGQGRSTRRSTGESGRIR